MSKNKALGLIATWLSPTTSDDVSLPPVRNAQEQVTTFFHADGAKLVRHLSAVYGNPDDAAEVAQETYYRMYDLLAAGHSIERPYVWAQRVARNLMLDRVQKRKNDAAKAAQLSWVVPLMDTSDAETLLMARERSLERRAALRRAFAALNEVERQCVIGRGEGLKLSQIGEIVGLSPKRVSEVFIKAIAKMQRTLRD